MCAWRFINFITAMGPVLHERVHYHETAFLYSLLSLSKKARIFFSLRFFFYLVKFKLAERQEEQR